MEQNEKSNPLHALRGMMESFDHSVKTTGLLVRFLTRLQLFYLTTGPDHKKFKDSEIRAILQEKLGRTEILNRSENDLQNLLKYICILILEVKKGYPLPSSPESFLSSKEKEEYDKEIKEEVFLGTINFLIRESFEPFESASFSKSEKKRLDNLRKRFAHANHRDNKWIGFVTEFRNNIENGRTKAPPGLLKFIHKYLALTVTT